MTQQVSTPATDAPLVARLRDGDPAAFEELVRTYMARMLRVARRLLMNEEDARDAVQDAFVSAFRSIRSFEGTSLLATWLHRIVVNACLVKLRTRRRHPEEDIEAYLPRFAEDGHQVEPSVAWREPADETLERAELGSMVRAAIGQLPETYRVILLLRDMEELPPAEVAEMLGITTNAVKIRLHRARQALRTLLDPKMKEDRR